MKENELLQKLHKAADLIKNAKDAGVEAEVHIEVKDGLETLKLEVSESMHRSGTFYISGRYTPEGGLHEH